MSDDDRRIFIYVDREWLSGAIFGAAAGVLVASVAAALLVLIL